MAQYSVGIDTLATGPLSLQYVLSEELAQDIFVMLLETAAPITRERTVPDEKNPGQTKIETYQDARKLGECLTDEATIFINAMVKRAIEHKRTKAQKAASAGIIDHSTILPGAAV